MKKIDFLIVGQGVAGTLLAHELIEKKQSILLIDNGQYNASQTCAGMVNPVVLKRFSPVWQGKAQILKAREVFKNIEEKLNKKMDYRFDIMRIFHSEAESNTWAKKSFLPQLDGLLDHQLHHSPCDAIQAPFGLGKINFGGRMDLHTLLASYRNHLADHDQILTETFDYQKLKFDNQLVTYKNIQARHVIFCEGYGLKQNPYFKHLPLNGNKGEVLTVRIPHLHLEKTIKSAVFIMPMPERGKDIYFVGATYNWNDKNTIPTDQGKKELLDKLRQILPEDIHNRIEILEHHAGMRPTVSDRRPLLGCHPTYKNLFVLNGLGTRGVMLGATMASLLSAHILTGEPLPDAVNINRFPELS